MTNLPKENLPKENFPKETFPKENLHKANVQPMRKPSTDGRAQGRRERWRM